MRGEPADPSHLLRPEHLHGLETCRLPRRQPGRQHRQKAEADGGEDVGHRVRGLDAEEPAPEEPGQQESAHQTQGHATEGEPKPLGQDQTDGARRRAIRIPSSRVLVRTL